MLEGTVLYFHLPTHISHGLIILVAGEKVKSFQTLWFTRLSGFVSAFTEYFQYCCCWPGPIGRIRIFNQRIFHYSFEPNPGLPGYWILFFIHSLVNVYAPGILHMFFCVRQSQPPSLQMSPGLAKLSNFFIILLKSAEISNISYAKSSF